MQCAVQIWFLITCGAGAAFRLCIIPIRSGLIAQPWAFWGKRWYDSPWDPYNVLWKIISVTSLGGPVFTTPAGQKQIANFFFFKVPNRLYCRASDAGENEMGTEERWVSSMPQVLTKPRRWCGHLDYSARSPPRWRRKRRTSRHVITDVMWSSVATSEGELRSWCILTYLQLRSTTKDDELSSDLKTEEVVHFDVYWSIFSLFFALGFCAVLGIAPYNKATVWTEGFGFIKRKNKTFSITKVNCK